MSDESPEERIYRGAVIRRHRDGAEPNGWWLLPTGALREHSEQAWVSTLEEAEAEVDAHVDGSGRCLLRERGALSDRPSSMRATARFFDRTILQGYSPWCAARPDQPHEPCTTRTCPCSCHGDRAGEPPPTRLLT